MARMTVTMTVVGAVINEMLPDGVRYTLAQYDDTYGVDRPLTSPIRVTLFRSKPYPEKWPYRRFTIDLSMTPGEICDMIEAEIGALA